MNRGYDFISNLLMFGTQFTNYCIQLYTWGTTLSNILCKVISQVIPDFNFHAENLELFLPNPTLVLGVDICYDFKL